MSDSKIDKNVYINNSQIVFFFNKKLDRPDKLYSKLEETNFFKNNFIDITPIIIPIPDDEKLDEVPVVQVQGDKISLALSRVKVTFSYQFDDKYVYNKNYTDNFFRQAIDLCEGLISIPIFDIKISRVGFISNYFVKCIGEGSPDQQISNLLNSKIRDVLSGESISESNFRLAKKVDIGEFVANNLLTLQGALITEIATGDESKIFLIQRDVNTIQENKYEFNKEKVKSFLTKAANQIRIADIQRILYEIN